MFARYSESAKRVLSFSLDEARERGSVSIRAEHLLLGVLRVADDITSTVVSGAGLKADAVKEELAEPKPPVPRSIEIPFHSETKRVLQYAADEADRLLHDLLLARGQPTIWMGRHIAALDDHIGPEHLLLGLLREDTTVAASILAGHGVMLEAARKEILRQNSLHTE